MREKNTSRDDARYLWGLLLFFMSVSFNALEFYGFSFNELPKIIESIIVEHCVNCK